MAVISVCATLFLIFAGLFVVVIDTRRHSMHHFREDSFEWKDEHKVSKHHRNGNHHHRSQGRSITPEDFKFKEESLRAHNKLRAAHGSPPLQFDDHLCELAEEWAEQIGEGSDALKRLVLSHTPDDIYKGGVAANLFASMGSKDLSGDGISQIWYKESALYNYSDPHYSPKYSDFSQLVWKKTNLFCISKYKTPIKGFTIYVATYAPRGNMNYATSFKENVLPPF